VLFLIDLHILIRAEKWRTKNREEVEKWFDAIADVEALNSLARFAHANPTYVMPEITDDEFTLKAVEMGHPLIKAEERTSNDFQTSDKGKIIVITGSNMSGKSTFLRTVGLNIVLALAGAPVCAERFTTSKFMLFTSMRTTDNLEHHVSSFYAELKRIEQLLTLVKAEKSQILFMLDEVLKGTNSQDRYHGAMAIIRQMHGFNTIGFISTHDIQLGEEAAKMSFCENFNFTSDVKEGKVEFDYKIKEGICKSFNASALMKSIGIEMGNSAK
jgi:DNA mismatch repair ATPase MutS